MFKSRWKLWEMDYWVNNNSTLPANYGASCFKLFTPFFGVIIRLWDYAPTKYVLLNSLEFAWNMSFEDVKEGMSYYKKQTVLIFKEVSLQEIYLAK